MCLENGGGDRLFVRSEMIKNMNNVINYDESLGNKALRRFVEDTSAYLQFLQNSPEEKSVETPSKEYIFVKADRKYSKIKLCDILFIEGLKDYIVIHTDSQKFITNTTLKAIQKQLSPELFLRTNKSYIVNLDKIDSFDMNDIYIGAHELAIGSRYKSNFMEQFAKKYMY